MAALPCCASRPVLTLSHLTGPPSQAVRCSTATQRQLRRSLFTQSPPSRHATTLRRSPAPPRLPKDEQATFEKLQSASTGAFSTPRRQPTPTASTTMAAEADSESGNGKGEPTTTTQAQVDASGDGRELHPDVRRGAPPEFTGERNPRTGEVGGPKNEPLRWGGEEGRDWSYNGRVTDF